MITREYLKKKQPKTFKAKSVYKSIIKQPLVFVIEGVPSGKWQKIWKKILKNTQGQGGCKHD